MSKVKRLSLVTRQTRKGQPFRRLVVISGDQGDVAGATHIAFALANRDGAEVTSLARADDHAEMRDALGVDARGALLIIGLERHGRANRLFGGAATSSAVRHPRVPVLAVPSNAKSLPRRAVAAIDFTPPSIASATLAASLLADDGILTIAHVASFTGAEARAGDLIDVYRAGERAKLQEAALEIRRRTGVSVETVVLTGTIADALLAYAAGSECDLIALGGHEQGFLDRLLLGSVRGKVLGAATCSVLIAPPEVDETEYRGTP